MSSGAWRLLLQVRGLCGRQPANYRRFDVVVCLRVQILSISRKVIRVQSS
jgi:hypothetical protein